MTFFWLIQSNDSATLHLLCQQSQRTQQHLLVANWHHMPANQMLRYKYLYLDQFESFNFCFIWLCNSFRPTNSFFSNISTVLYIFHLTIVMFWHKLWKQCIYFSCQDVLREFFANHSILLKLLMSFPQLLDEHRTNFFWNLNCHWRCCSLQYLITSIFFFNVL